jgi:hypothetical protein
LFNDSSEDKTGRDPFLNQAMHPELKFINGKPLRKDGPENVLPANSSMKHPKVNIFLFTDADTSHNKNSLRDSVTIALNRNADM